MGQSLHVDHIDPTGGEETENLALACASCNLSKQAATYGVDPVTGDNVALFNPRTQGWNDHFGWSSDFATIVGLTPAGRATVVRLKMNTLRQVLSRRVWVRAGAHPPENPA